VSQAQLNTLLAQLGGGHITAFILVLARVSPLFVLAPLFSSKMLPVRVRAIVAVALSIGLTGIASRGQKIPTDVLSVAGLVIVQLLVGLAFSYAVGAVLTAIEAAGSLVDASSGFSYGAMVDPINGNQGGALTSLYSIVGLGLFIAIGGDAYTLKGLTHTFTLVPLTHGVNIDHMAAGGLTAFGSIFVGAVEVAAPATLALLVTDVAFGMVSRVVPQLNVFGVGFPMKVGVALLVVAASLPFVGGFMSDQIVTTIQNAMQSI
jgi:flagellar biosynthetic protein FliR